MEYAICEVSIVRLFFWKGTLMDHPQAPPKNTAPPNGLPEKNRLELIRFATKEARVQAIGALLEYGMLNFTSYRDEEWYVQTPVARALRALGVPFDWLTEHA